MQGEDTVKQEKHILLFSFMGMGSLMGAMANPLLMKRLTAVARGRVQGVGYRYHVSDCARKTGIMGFVRNLPDGSVQIVAEGSDDALDEFMRRIRADGDPIICVEEIDIESSDSTGEFPGFGIRR